jgi:predicted hotdog family 3-hydroxylacyl-ACP dehydratase
MSHWPIEELLPHAGEMILLDAVLEAGEEHMVCRRSVRPDPFSDTDGSLPAWAGVELMAQCVAAWAGWQARHEQRAVQLGFLLGTRHYRCDVAAFPAGSELTVSAVRNFHDDNGMAVFACRIEASCGCAEARLTVFSPPDFDVFLATTAQNRFFP